MTNAQIGFADALQRVSPKAVTRVSLMFHGSVRQEVIGNLQD